jgi:hypothetical protein
MSNTYNSLPRDKPQLPPEQARDMALRMGLVARERATVTEGSITRFGVLRADGEAIPKHGYKREHRQSKTAKLAMDRRMGLVSSQRHTVRDGAIVRFGVRLTESEAAPRRPKPSRRLSPAQGEAMALRMGNYETERGTATEGSITRFGVLKAKGAAATQIETFDDLVATFTAAKAEATPAEWAAFRKTIAAKANVDEALAADWTVREVCQALWVLSGEGPAEVPKPAADKDDAVEQGELRSRMAVRMGNTKQKRVTVREGSLLRFGTLRGATGGAA